jgi:phosphoserine phosphatase RsbU/P
VPAELTIAGPDGKTRTVQLSAGRMSLGRSSGNEIWFPDDVGLSRQHATLERQGGSWIVRDLGSKNGTYVNGLRVDGTAPLNPGDRIVASRVVLVYDPGAVAQTVVFGGGTAMTPEGTISTTLAHLLAARKHEPTSQPGPSPGWGDPVEALLSAGRALAPRMPLPELFRAILELAIEAAGARRGVLMTCERSGLAVQASRGDGLRISTAVRDRVLEGKTSVLVRDTRFDDALRERMSIAGQSIHSLMAVPLQTDSDVIGLIYVDSPPLTREFSNHDLNLLTAIANVAALRIERERLAEVEQAERIMASELEQAAEIQKQFLPASPPVLEKLELAGYNAACRTVGGDYYDFLKWPDGRVGLVIGDVAGKGMPAALLMTSLQARVQALAEAGVEPSACMTRLNKGLASTCPPNRFVTFFAALLDPETGQLTYSNAGHNPPLLVRASGAIESLETGGPVLALLRNVPYREARTELQPGDLLLLYSDGVTEASSPAGEEFDERLRSLLDVTRGESAAAVVQAVCDALENWTAGQPATDDVTVVAARRMPAYSSTGAGPITSGASGPVPGAM